MFLSAAIEMQMISLFDRSYLHSDVLHLSSRKNTTEIYSGLKTYWHP